jgi:hypothetical protein
MLLILLLLARDVIFTNHNYRLRCTVLAFRPGEAMKLIDVHKQFQIEEQWSIWHDAVLKGLL